MTTASDWIVKVASYAGTPGPGILTNRMDVEFVPGMGLFWAYQINGDGTYLELYNGTSWSLYWYTAEPLPPFGNNIRMVHDPIRNVLICVMFGGVAPFASIDTWEITLGIPAILYRGTFSFIGSEQDALDVVWDSTRSQAIMVAGTKDGGFLATYFRTYTYNTGAGTWTKVIGEDDPGPPPHPSFRKGFAFAYDVLRDKVVLAFGYSPSTGVRNNETWEFDPALNTWAQQFPATSPSKRYGAEGVYNPILGGLVVFGGWDFGPTTIYDGTWLYDGITWSEPLGYSEYSYTAITWAAGPDPDVARDQFYFGYDSDRDRLIIHHYYLIGKTARGQFAFLPSPLDTREWAPASGASPFLENRFPAAGSTGVSINTNISFFIVDGGSGIAPYTIDAYVDGYDAYNGYAGFSDGYNGPDAYFGADSYGLSDAYSIVIDPTTPFSVGDIVTIRVTAYDGYLTNFMDENWSFHIGHGPFVEQEDPTPGETGVSLYKEISCFITDSDSVVRSDRIDAYIDGIPIYDGLTDTFTAPYNGPNSGLLFVPLGSLGGLYDGYRLTIDRVGAYPKYTLYTLRVTAEDMADIAEDHSWLFSTETFAPFFESQNPANGAINVPIDSNIYVVCADGYNLVASSTIAVQVNGVDAYSAGVGFVAPYNGPTSNFVHVIGGSVDGYDAYQITIDSTVNFGYNQLISVAAQVLNADGQPGAAAWSFTTLSVPATPPQITHIVPASGSIIPQGSNITFDIFDIENDLDPTTIRVTVDGSLAYSGAPGSFFTPYTGVDSYAGPIIVDGYDGYHIVLDNIGAFGSIVAVNVQAQDGYGSALNQSWGYTTSSGLNRLYYSDDYGVSKIDLIDLVGEGQFASRRFLTTTTAPAIPTNKVISISGNLLDGYALLVLSMGPDGYGVRIVTNESSINTYSDGYDCGRAQLSDKGILYLVNKTRNRIEAYYGAHLRPGAGRVPDYVYDGYSTPALFSNGGNTGTILTIHVVSDDSSELSSGARLYVGQSIGMTIIDTFDQEVTPGFSAGLDSYGVSTFCGIVGSGATFESVGGTVPNVTDVATDERYGIIFAVTNDGAAHGGLTQISMSANRMIVFMDENSGFVPSNDIRKVSKNE